MLARMCQLDRINAQTWDRFSTSRPVCEPRTFTELELLHNSRTAPDNPASIIPRYGLLTLLEQRVIEFGDGLASLQHLKHEGLVVSVGLVHLRTTEA